MPAACGQAPGGRSGPTKSPGTPPKFWEARQPSVRPLMYPPKGVENGAAGRRGRSPGRSENRPGPPTRVKPAGVWLRGGGNRSYSVVLVNVLTGEKTSGRMAATKAGRTQVRPVENGFSQTPVGRAFLTLKVYLAP